MLSFDRFKTKTGGFIDPKGCYHETADSVIQVGILGFCGCGDPDENVTFIGKILRLFEYREQNTYEQWKSKVRELLPNGDIEYFIWYWLDKEEYTEHGGSVPGWLTDKGKQLLSDITQWEQMSE